MGYACGWHALAEYGQMLEVEVTTFPVAPLGCNCSILRCKITDETVVLDPGGEADRIIAELEKRNAKVVHILHTHAHFDHVLGTHDLACHCQKKQTGVDPDKKTSALTIGLHKDDESLYDMVETQCRWFGLPPQRAETPINHWLQDDEVFEFGRARLQTLHTPGHTAGSCSFILQNAGVVFTGDTLFAGGIGRTDLPGGDFQQILKSIRERLLRLDDATQVVPGHGGFTRIFEEKQQNPFLN